MHSSFDESTEPSPAIVRVPPFFLGYVVTSLDYLLPFLMKEGHGDTWRIVKSLHECKKLSGERHVGHSASAGGALYTQLSESISEPEKARGLMSCHAPLGHPDG